MDKKISQAMKPLDPEEFRRQGHMIVDFLADYYHNIEKYPVRSQVEPHYLRNRIPKSAPYNPESIEKILEDVTKDIVPGITHWQSPSFFAYFPSSASTAGFLGEMLSSGFNVVGFNWLSSPVATELESIVIDWFGELLKLPSSFLFSGGGGGVLQGTTCEAVLCTLVASRDQILRKIGQENINKLIVYVSDQTHSSLQKASQIAGILRENCRILPTTKETEFSLSPETLSSAIVADIEAGLVPFYLCVTIGTTSSNAVDPLIPLCNVAKDYDIWVHVDAAYAGSSCICPEFQHFLEGVEGANSISLNAHKWFFTNFDCCCLWVKDPSALIKALSTNPEYLRNLATESKEVVDYKDWQIALSRRFRALKLWLVFRSYGVTNLRSFLRSHVDMAKYFEGLVVKDTRFEIVVPRNFAMVCFRVSPLIISKYLNNFGETKDVNVESQMKLEKDVNELKVNRGKHHVLSEFKHVNGLKVNGSKPFALSESKDVNGLKVNYSKPHVLSESNEMNGVKVNGSKHYVSPESNDANGLKVNGLNHRVISKSKMMNGLNVNGLNHHVLHDSKDIDGSKVNGLEHHVLHELKDSNGSKVNGSKHRNLPESKVVDISKINGEKHRVIPKSKDVNGLKFNGWKHHILSESYDSRMKLEEDVNEFNRMFLESINASGQVYMTHSVVGGVYFIRFAVGASLTDYQHVDMAWKLIQDQAKVMLRTL